MLLPSVFILNIQNLQKLIGRYFRTLLEHEDSQYKENNSKVT